MNKKPTILAVAALGSLALIGTGFAGWVIAANAETSADGTIKAYTVTDNRLEIDGNPTWDNDNKAEIRFGMTEDTSGISKPWFTFNEEDGIEKLDATYTVRIKSKNTADTGKVKVTVNLGVVEAEEKDPNKASIDAAVAAWTTAVNDKLVAGPTYEIKCGDKAADEVNGDALTENGLNYAVKVQFAWGDYFKINGQGEALNPYKFYNSFTASDKGNDAAEKMVTLSAINSARFVLKLNFDRVETK